MQSGGQVECDFARAPNAPPQAGLFARRESPFGADFQERSRKKVMW